MGISFSSNRRRNNNYYHQNPPSQLISSSSYPPVDPSNSTPPYIYSNPPPPPPPQPQPQPQPRPPSGLPPPTPPVYLPYDGSNYSNNALIVRPNFVPYNHHPQGNYSYGWMPPPMRPPPVVPAPPTYVDHQQAKKVKNHVNVHKDTLTVVVDEENPDCHLVSFVFDAMFDGSITIYYFGKEESDCKFNPVYAEAFVPVKVPFQKGIGQRFRQPSGTGIDLGFFELDALSKPSIGEDVFPLVICAETTLPLFPTDEHLYDLLPSIATGPHMQITQAVLEKNNNGDGFKVRVMRQILWIDGVRYELREIYGIGQSAESFNDTASGAECVICMTEPKDTAVLPCRHMCLCSECAKALRLQSNKCPICRQPIEELMEIKINTVDQ